MVIGSSTHLVGTIRSANTLGEGVIWRTSDQSCWWVDIQEAKLFKMDWPSCHVQTFDLPFRASAITFLNCRDDIVCLGSERGFALFSPISGSLNVIEGGGHLGSDLRLNDGKAGPDGAFWCGGIYEGHDAENRNRTHLYRMGRDGIATKQLGNIEIFNGLEWSPDGAFIYFTDTPTRTIMRATFDSESGKVGCFSAFYECSDGFPDGAAVDADGNYWTALWGAGKIIGIDNRGRKFAEIPVPATQPTCLAFGGPDLNIMFVTSARQGLQPDVLEGLPLAGSLFILDTAYTGCSSRRIQLDVAVLDTLNSGH